MSSVRPMLLPFASYLRSAMAKRGHTQTSLALEMWGTIRSRSRLNNWCDGRNLPTVTDAELLADTLNDRRIFNLVVSARTGRCAFTGCGRTYHRISQSRQRYCSARCRNRANETKRRRDPRQEAIDAMCASCQPEGICREPDCDLRPFSPFLFIPMHEFGRKAS